MSYLKCLEIYVLIYFLLNEVYYSLISLPRKHHLEDISKIILFFISMLSGGLWVYLLIKLIKG